MKEARTTRSQGGSACSANSGYDPAIIWPNGPLAEDFGVLRLMPRRIELWSLAALIQSKPPQIWRT